MSSNHLILYCPLLLLPSIFPSIRVFSNETVIHIRMSNYWSFSLSINPSNEYSGLNPLGLTGLVSLQSKLLSRVFSNTTVQKQQFFSTVFFMFQLPHLYMTPGSIIALTRQMFVGKVMSLLFNTLSRFVIGFFPRGKFLLISGLQSQSTVILEPKKRVCHCFPCFPIYFPWSLPWSSLFERWVLSQLFNSPFSPSTRGSLVPLHFLPLGWCHLHIWDYWYFSWKSWFQLCFIQPGISHDIFWIEVKQAGWQYTALTYSFPDLEPVCSMSSSNCCFLTRIPFSQEADKVVWYSHL